MDKMLVKITSADNCLSVLRQGEQNAGHCYIYNQHKDTIALNLRNTWLQELMCPFCVTFDFGSAKVFSTATFETYFYYHKDYYGLLQLISICTFYLTVLSPLKAIVQLIIYFFITFSLPINAVLELFNGTILVLYLVFTYILSLSSLINFLLYLYIYHMLYIVMLYIVSSIFNDVQCSFPRLWGMSISILE